MHLSMLAGRGGRPGKGAGFDEKVYPMNGEFDHQNSPGAGAFDKFEKNWRPFCCFAYIKQQGHSWITGTSMVHLGLILFIPTRVYISSSKWRAMQNAVSVDCVIDLNILIFKYIKWLFVNKYSSQIKLNLFGLVFYFSQSKNI